MNITEVFNTMSYGPAPESKENVSQWLADNKKGFSLYINGEWVKPAKNKLFDSYNPATGELLGKVIRDPNLSEFWHRAMTEDGNVIGEISMQVPRVAELKANATNSLSPSGELIAKIASTESSGAANEKQQVRWKGGDESAHKSTRAQKKELNRKVKRKHQ